MIKNSIKENVNLEGLEEAKSIKVDAKSEATKMGEARNAFELLLNRSKGDKITPKKSVKKCKKKIGLIEKCSPDIRMWLRKGRESPNIDDF